MAAVAGEHTTVDDETPTDTGGEHHAHQIAGTDRVAEPLRSQHDRHAVAMQVNGDVAQRIRETVADQLTKWMTTPSGQVDGGDGSVVLVDRPCGGNAHADHPCTGRNLRECGVDDAHNALFEFGAGGIGPGGCAIASRLEHLPGGIDPRGFDLRSTEVDGEDNIIGHPSQPSVRVTRTVRLRKDAPPRWGWRVMR